MIFSKKSSNSSGKLISSKSLESVPFLQLDNLDRLVLWTGVLKAEEAVAMLFFDSLIPTSSYLANECRRQVNSGMFLLLESKMHGVPSDVRIIPFVE